MKLCPFCAEQIQDAAIVCKHCGRELVAAPSPPPPPPPHLNPNQAVKEIAPPPAKMSRGKIILAALAGLVILGALSRFRQDSAPAGPSIGTPTPPMKLLVTTQPDVIQITNETDATWDQCHVTIEGDYASEVDLMKPRDTVRLAYTTFERKGQRIPSGEARIRARQSLEINCAGSDYERHRQTFRGTP